MLPILALWAVCCFAQESLEDLIHQLDDNDVSKREEATSKLKGRPLSDLPALEEAYRKAPNEECRARLGQALPAIRRQRYENFFAQISRNAGQPDWDAVQALRRLDSSEVLRLLKGQDGRHSQQILGALLEIFRENEDVFRSVLHDHSLSIPPDLAPRVARCLTESKTPSSHAAIRCLAHLRSEHGLIPGVDWESVARTTTTLSKTADHPARLEALQALPSLGDEESVGALLDSLKDPEDKVQGIGLASLRMFLETRPRLSASARFVEPLLSSKSLEVRRLAYEALSVAPRADEDRPRVIRAFAEEPPEVRWGALELAAALRDPSLAGDIAKLVPGKEGPKAVEVLFRISIRAAADHLLPCLKHRSSMTKAWIEHVRLYEEPEALEPLRRSLGDVMARGDEELWSSVYLLALQIDAWFDAESVEAAASSPDGYRRSHALERVGTAATARGIEVLRKALREENDSVRSAAIGAVTRGKVAACRADLLEFLKGEGPHTKEAMVALRGLGDTSVLPKIMPFLDSRDLRLAALESAFVLGTPEDAPTLLDATRLLESDRDKKTAVAGVARLLGDRAEGTLRTLMGDRRLRGPALAVLAERGAISCASEAARYLSDSDPVAVRAAADLQGQSRNVEAIPHLIPLLEDREIRSPAAGALARMPREKVAPLVERHLRSRDPGIRGAAAEILNGCDADELLANVKELLGDPSPQVSLFGVLTVRRRQLKDQLREVEMLSRHSDPRLRREALATLAELDWPGQRAKLLDRLRKGEEGSLSEIAPLFTAHKDSEPVPFVLERTKENGEVAYDAWVALNAFRKPESYARAAAPSLLGISRSSFGSLREKARTLGREAAIAFQVEVPVPQAPRASFKEAFSDNQMGVGGAGGGGSYSGSSGRYSLLEKIRAGLGTDVIPILEDDAVRIVTREQATTFWRAWVSDLRTK